MPSERVQRQIDRLLDEAEASSAVRDWTAVREKAEHALTFDPENEDAAALLRAAERGLGETPVPDANARPAVAARPLPTSFASGRYMVERFLGEGGRKRVYLAHDERLDRDVAFAVIKTEGLDMAGLARVRNEAQDMARLGDQANIVTVFDVGDDPSSGSGQGQSQPYIVSQYMAGGSVEDLIAKAEDHRLPLEQTLSIAAQVCHALEHAHRQGIVHRDLKPGNVWLTADGTAKLGDFGLAVALDRSRVTMAGMMLGTVAYMPPEQALGGESTRKADLYSLGCMLYEMVTGRPPFVGEDPTAVISQHINTPPVAPSWLTEHCPPGLEEVILQLLAKNPEQRPESAAAVRAALAKVDPSQKSASHSDSSENPLDRLARGVFVGRQAELEKLRKAFDEAFAGRGGLVMLVGEPGIGKTRTSQELETYARMRGAQVFGGRTHESGGAPPYWPWIQIGNQWGAANDPAALASMGSIAGYLVRIFPNLRQVANFPEPAEGGDAETAQFRLFEAYVAFLRIASAQAPVLITIDDLHWADKSSLHLLQHVARELSRLRVLVVGNYRDTDLSRSHPLSESLAVLNRDPGFARIVLRGLSRDEVASYIGDAAHVEPRREVLDRIYEETEGNPFFLSEVVNLMAQEGTLQRESVSDIRIPDGVREALSRRLDLISGQANELLQTCAVAGREFNYDTLTLLGDRDEETLLRLIEEALKASVIEEMDQAGRYRFTHALMQETLLSELSTTRRVRLHGRVGEALELRWGEQLARERAPRLAQHFVEASTLTARHLEKAAFYSKLAGEQALAQAAYAEAVHHFRAALAAREGQPMDDEMADLLFELGSASLVTTEFDEAWQAFERAFHHYATTGNVARAVDVADQAAGDAVWLRGHGLATMIERALELVQEGTAEYGRLNSALAHNRGVQGDDIGAQEAFARARNVATRLGLRDLELLILRRESFNDLEQLRSAECSTKAERAIVLARQLDEPFLETVVQWCAAIGLLFTGRIDSATKHTSEGLALAERLRHRVRITVLASTLANCAICAGDWATARASIARALEANLSDPYVFLVWLNRVLGDSTGADRALNELTEHSKTWPRGNDELYGLPWPSVVGLATALLSSPYLGGPAQDEAWARNAADRVLQSPTVSPRAKANMRAGLAFHAVLHDDKDAARELLDGLPALHEVNHFNFAWDHTRGLLLQTLDRLDEAVEAFEAALDLLSRGYRALYVLAAHDCARVRLDRGTPADRERAAALTEEALGIANELGMKPWVQRLLGLKLELQGAGPGLTSSIGEVARQVQSEHPAALQQAASDDGNVTIMFSDIAGSTARAEALGDERWLDVIRVHNATVREQVRAYGGREVANRGDGFMVAFASPRAGVECAISIQRAFAVHTASHDHEPIEVHIGLHTGHPAQDEGNFYGTDVNLAARIGDYVAQAGQIMISERLRDALRRSRSLRFGDGREVELKGLSGKHRVFEVLWE